MYHKTFINCKPVIISVMVNVAIFFANLIQKFDFKVRYKKKFSHICHSRCFGIRGGHGKSAFKLAVKLSVELGYVILSLRL
jgi:hypothetical protein